METTYYEQLTRQFALDNTTLLVAAIISFIVGYLQYIYAIRVMLREGKGPMPYWMHSFYLAHDSTWSYVLAKAAARYDEHWFLRGTSTALFLWATLEIWCIHRAITKERQANFASIFGPSPPLTAVICYSLIFQLAMYSVVLVGIVLMGEGCVMQWFCLTNVLIVVGPTHEYLRRGSREGLSLGFCLVNIIGTIWTFAPFSMWALTIPDMFTRPAYYAVGVALTIYSIWCFYVVAQYPPKPRGKNGEAPIW